MEKMRGGWRQMEGRKERNEVAGVLKRDGEGGRIVQGR